MAFYRVDETLIDDYIKRLNKQRWIVLLTVMSFIFPLFILSYYGDIGPLILFIFFVTGVIIAGSFYFGLNYKNEKDKLFFNVEFFIDESTIKCQPVEKPSLEFKLTDLAVIDVKKARTILVKGSNWTKINYRLPKKHSPYQIGFPGVMYIPDITSNYQELIDLIKASAVNASKI